MKSKWNLIVDRLDFDHFLVDNSRGIVCRSIVVRAEEYKICSIQLMVYQVRESQQQVGFCGRFFRENDVASRSGPTDFSFQMKAFS